MLQLLSLSLCCTLALLAASRHITLRYLTWRSYKCVCVCVRQVIVKYECIMSRYFQVCKETWSSITSRVGRGRRVRNVGGNFYAKMCEARVHLHFASFLQGHTHIHTQRCSCHALARHSKFLPSITSTHIRQPSRFPMSMCGVARGSSLKLLLIRRSATVNSVKLSAKLPINSSTFWLSQLPNKITLYALNYDDYAKMTCKIQLFKCRKLRISCVRKRNALTNTGNDY